MIAQSEDRCLPQMPSAKCCRELVKPEIVGVEFSTFCNSLEVIQEIQLWKRDGPCRYPRSGQLVESAITRRGAEESKLGTSVVTPNRPRRVI